MNIGVIYAGLGGTEVGDAVAAALSGVVVVLLMAGGLMDLVCACWACALPSVPAAAPPRSSSASSRPSPARPRSRWDFSTQRILGLDVPALYLVCCNRYTYRAARPLSNQRGNSQMKKLFNEFKAFALRGNVMDMAIGVLIGSAFSGIVTSLTETSSTLSSAS